MSKVQILRALLKQRLPADDDEEIFQLFDRTIAEYEQELCRLKEENERQRKLLEAVCNSDDKTDVQELLVKETEVPSEKQPWTSSLDQEDPQLLHIKKEEEELWTCEEREHLQVLEVNSSMYTIDDVKPQSSHCHQPQSEENREAVPVASSSAEQMKTEDDKEAWEGSEPVARLDQDGYLHPHSDTMISHSFGPESHVIDDDWKDSKEPKSVLNFLRIPLCDKRCHARVKPFNSESDQRIVNGSNLMRHTGEKLFSCLECDKTFNRNSNLQTHMLIHTGDQKSFSCSECGNIFSQKSSLNTHMLIHTGERPFSCSECGKTFNKNSNLKTHMLIHTGERPFSCSECGKTFNKNGNLKIHMLIHTGEKPYSCSECGKTFNNNGSLTTHMLIHTGERPFHCSVCEKTFKKNSLLKFHMVIHTGKRPFSCSECGKTFNKSSILRTHMIIHKGNKPFNCSECGKSFCLKGNLKRHMITHTGVKPFQCSDCGKTFIQKRHLRNHMTGHARARTKLFINQ